MVSDILGPNGDERCGVRDKWMAFCHRRKIKSYISDYRDNRFNSSFRGAAELIHHHKDILMLENYIDSPNKKIQSVLLDIKDTRIVTFVQALALVYVKISNPYWTLIHNKKIEYYELRLYIQHFAMCVTRMVYSPEIIFDNSVTFFLDIEPDKSSVLYSDATVILHPDRTKLLLETISAIATGLRKTIDNQLADFLKG